MDQLLRDLKTNGLIEGLMTPEQVAIVLRKFAEWFPFENLDVIRKNEAEITPEFLTTKIIKSRRGGLCYEMNALLYLVLQELGFEVELGAATVNNEGNWAINRTHAMVLLTIDGKRYVADGGFGNRLALSPLSLDGGAVTSPAGTFRIRTMKTDKGSIALQCKNNDGDWLVHYAFDWVSVPWQELNRMKRDIHHHPQSTFNKKLLIAKVLPDGTQSINEERQLRKWIDGREEVTIFETKSDLLAALRSHCSSAIVAEAEKYIHSI